ncbi:sugar transporter domain-containing protein [Phthorimaea operculella]|nr:sugar transporter domain-containing protein [Phthorimaea operculella]
MVFTITKSESLNITERETNCCGVWKQFFFAILASIPFITHGVESTELSASVHAGHFTSTPGHQFEVPWTTTAMILAAAASAPVYCYLMDSMGRKSGIYLLNLAQGASCIPLFLPPTEESMIILHILAGVSTAGLFTVLPAYIREISDDRIRGVNLTLMMPMTAAGWLTYMVTDLEAMMFLMVALVVAQFLALLVLVESPSYLVRAGKIEKAKISIAKLRCVNEDDEEVKNVINSIQEESRRAKSNGDLTLWRILKNPLYRDITKIGLVLATTITLGGSIVFLDQDKALAQLNEVLDSKKTMLLSCLAAGSFITLLVSKFVERKYVLVIAFIAMIFASGLLAIFTQSDLTVFSLRWLPRVSLGVLVLAFGSIWGLPAIVMAEMLNVEIRSKLLGVVFVYSQLIKLAHVHSFQYIEQQMGLYTLFYVFAGVNMFGGVYTLFIMPKIKAKTVRQIEKQMKRVPLLVFNRVKA